MKLKGLFSSKTKAINEWFLKEKKPYDQRRIINLENFFWVSGIALVLAVLVILFTPVVDTNSEPSSSNQNLPTPQKSSQEKDTDRMNSPGVQTQVSTGQYSAGISMPARSRTANQIIRRSTQNSDSTGQISMGTTIGAKLLNAVVSANTASPAIAIIQDESQKIPAGSKAIGSATFDEQGHRMAIHFNTIVYPDGEQHNVQAIAMMPDGSAGLEGDYSSGEGKRQAGRFFGYFIGGMADGMKERQQGSMMGGPFEPGSIKNGVLNGISQSADDQAHQYSDSMSSAHASMSLPPAMEFIFYFEHEFSP